VAISVSSSPEKKTSSVGAKFKVKKSARERGTPSRIFLSEEIEGLTRFCSISEIAPLVTPARRANSRWVRPKIWRTSFSLAPISSGGASSCKANDMGFILAFSIFNKFMRVLAAWQ
jgi:hypothetical protein